MSQSPIWVIPPSGQIWKSPARIFWRVGIFFRKIFFLLKISTKNIFFRNFSPTSQNIRKIDFPKITVFVDRVLDHCFSKQKVGQNMLIFGLKMLYLATPQADLAKKKYTNPISFAQRSRLNYFSDESEAYLVSWKIWSLFGFFWSLFWPFLKIPCRLSDEEPREKISKDDFFFIRFSKMGEICPKCHI